MHGVRRVTVVSQYAPKVTASGIVSSNQKILSIYTFRARNGFSEDSIVRHIDPTQAHRLELARMSNYKIKQAIVPNRAVHVYEGVDDSKTGATATIREGEKSVKDFLSVLWSETCVVSQRFIIQVQRSSNWMRIQDLRLVLWIA